MNLSRRLSRLYRWFVPHGGRTAFRKLEILGLAGNQVTLDTAKSASGRIQFERASGNRVVLDTDATLNGVILIFGNGNTVRLGKDVSLRGRITIKGDNHTVTIGEGTTCAGVSILSQEGADITIGRMCMLSRNIEIRSTDAHSVIDQRTGRRLNHAAPVTIGDHVWIGLGCVINKGAVIPNDSIVGAMSFVNKNFTEPNTVIAGSPAKIVKRGVTWNRNRRKRFSRDQIDGWHGHDHED